MPNYGTPTKPRNIRVPERIWLAAQVKAREQEETVSAVVVRALRRYIGDES